MLTVIFIFVALLGGCALSIQSSINGRLGSAVGVLATAWLTFVLGALISALLVLFVQAPQAQTLLDVPKWQLTGAFFGVSYILVMVFAVPRVGIAAATIAVITGQLAMSLLIDNFGWLGNAPVPFDTARLFAVLLLGAALVLVHLGNRKTARSAAATRP
jgi:transporter family-2 protein